MGLGRRTFAPGEVLTASNVMNYLQDQSVMSFAGTAARGSAIGTAVAEGMVSYLRDTNFLQVRDDNAWHSIAGVQAVANATVRDSLIPSPNQGDKVFRSDLGYEQTYYAAWGTANPGGRASAGWYNDQRNIGLVPIVPPTVNVSGGTATANTLGTVSFTGVTSISLNNVFSSAYTNYKINVNITSVSTNNDKYFRFRAGGSDITATNYISTGFYSLAAGGTGQAGNGTAGNSWNFIIGGLRSAVSELTIFNPNEATKTRAVASVYVDDTPSTNNAYNYNAGTILNQTTQIDGFSIYPGSGNITGTITVYGFNS